MSASVPVEQASATEAVNEVRLVGRVSQQPQERVLPSGDSLWSFRVVVPRPEGRSPARAQVDAVD
jgi:single-strand DNA-binding protein